MIFTYHCRAMIRKYLKPGNILFIALLGILLYAPARIKVQSWIMSFIGSPNSMEQGIALKPSEMDYTFYNMEGDSFNLLNFRGKPMFLNFWATWCGPCKAELPSIAELVKAHSGNGEIFLISNENPKEIRKFITDQKLKLPIYFSPTIPSFVTTRSIPVTYLIDSLGTVVIHKNGASDWSDPHILELLK